MILFSRLLDFLLEEIVVNLSRHYALAVDKMTPVRHPLDGNNIVPVARDNVGLLVLIRYSGVVILAMMILVHVIFHKIIVLISADVNWLSSENLRWLHK